MAVNPSLAQFFGESAAISPEGIVSFDPTELVSVRTPTGFIALSGTSWNAEQLAGALINRWSEQFDQSQDAEFQIFQTEIAAVTVPRDGIGKSANQYLFTIRVLNFLNVQLPNPNLL
jgi:hypothetical protein